MVSSLSIGDIKTWRTDPSTKQSTQAETLFSFSFRESGQSYHVEIQADSGSRLNIEFRSDLSTAERAPLNLRGNSVHFDPNQMTMPKVDALIEEAQKSFKTLFEEPTGEGDGDRNTLESLDVSNSHSGQVFNWKADAGRMLDYAVESMTQRDKLDQITSTLIKNRYERYRLNRDTRPKDGLAEFEGLIRADLHSRNINWVEQWRAVTDLASAIVAVEAPHGRKVRLTRGLSQALFKTPTTGEHPANDVIGSSDAQKDPGSVSGA